LTLYDSLLAFTLAAALLTLTPGLDTALVLRTASVESRAQAFKVALGINARCFIWGAMVAFGLGALIAVSELAYSILKYCGANRKDATMNVSSRTVVLLNVLAAAGLFLTLSSKYNWF